MRVVHPDLKSLNTLCWNGSGRRLSQVCRYHCDRMVWHNMEKSFSARISRFDHARRQQFFSANASQNAHAVTRADILQGDYLTACQRQNKSIAISRSSRSQSLQTRAGSFQQKGFTAFPIVEYALVWPRFPHSESCTEWTENGGWLSPAASLTR